HDSASFRSRYSHTPPVSRSSFTTHPSPPAISTLSLHDALPISRGDPDPACREPRRPGHGAGAADGRAARPAPAATNPARRHPLRSEEHTSELQSRGHLVCRLLLEKKN